MTDRKPSRATLAKNAFGRVQKFKDKIVHAEAMRQRLQEKYDMQLMGLREQLKTAEKELEELQR